MFARLAAAAIGLALVNAPWTAAGGSSAQTAFERCLRDGDLLGASEEVRELPKRDPNTASSWKNLGWFELMENRLPEARAHLRRALKLDPSDRETKALLSLAWYRTGDLSQSAAMQDDLGYDALAELVATLEPKAYALEGATSVRLGLFPESLRPKFPVRVNGKDAQFFLDTRGGMSAINDTVARAAKVERQQSNFLQFWFWAAGKWSVKNRFGRVETLNLGSMQVRRVPVLLPNWKGLVDGLLGTDFLSHFETVIDYPRRELFLRKADPDLAEARRADKDPGRERIVLPFFWTPGGQIVLQGQVNGTDAVFLLDTVAVGRPVTLSRRLIHRAHLPAHGGYIISLRRAGLFPWVYTEFRELRIGPIVQSEQKADIGTMYDFPPSIDHMQGFPIDGILGNAFFQAYRLTLDFRHTRVMLEPSKSIGATDDRVRVANPVAER
ncbi:aspartyl protease family protein [Verrucomicrobium sp. 3C]|uniref:aspartyl protease family protein n=1 Tax=Verrucomicrobium sp. 3C TaxID=1134055 RepID=UPI00036ABFC8|nr:aspartyl protease family protein [Verrucomicrobium sp. 3C]